MKYLTNYSSVAHPPLDSAEAKREKEQEPQPEPQPETSETSETSAEETDNTLTLTWDTHPNLTREDIASHIRTSLKAIGVTGVEIN